MKHSIVIAIVLASGLVFSTDSFAQKKNSDKETQEGYQFKDIISIPVTPVKNQYRSGTCWCFASMSFIEAELIRVGQGEYDLSEMFGVRMAYQSKAVKYVRMHGKTNFAGGGLAHDVLWVWDNFGFVPEEAYPGLEIGEKNHIHGEMDAVLSGYINEVIKNRNRKLSSVWNKGFNSLLDAYLGDYPAEFTYEGKSYTPESFAAEFKINPEDYVAIGSYTHHPFNETFVLEIPDNWMWGEIYNVPMDEMMRVLDHAIESGYSVLWDADVSEKGFDWKNGVALIPSEEIEDLDGLERARWDELSPEEKKDLFYDFSSPRKEKVISQALRQASFDNYLTTDDHLMHITGIATDQNGSKFYRVKNSWGTENHVYDGYLYASNAYMQYKTIFFMVHKDALPEDIAAKLGL